MVSTEENDRLIDIFNDNKLFNKGISYDCMNYINNWNLLMGVVHKIRIFHNSTTPLSDRQIEELVKLIKKLNEALTLRNEVCSKAVYNACLGFIKWYNENCAKKE